MSFLRTITRPNLAILLVIVIVVVDILIGRIIIDIMMMEEMVKSSDGCNLFLINRTEWLSGKLFVDTFSTKRIEFQRDTTTPTSTSAASGESLKE